MREIRMLRAMWRELETGPRWALLGHEGGNPGYGQGCILTGNRASSRPYPSTARGIVRATSRWGTVRRSHDFCVGIAHLTDLMRRQRHLPVREQALNLRRVLRGHYAYYGIAGNFRALQKVQRFVERYWRKMLSSRSRAGYVTWEAFVRITTCHPLPRPKLALSYGELQRCAVL